MRTRHRQVRQPKEGMLDRCLERVTVDVDSDLLEKALSLRGGLPVSVVFSEALYLWIANREDRPASWPTVVVPLLEKRG